MCLVLYTASFVVLLDFSCRGLGGVFHSILVFMSALPKEGMVVFSSNLIGQSTNLPIGRPMESYTDMSSAATVVIRGEGTER